MAILHRILSDTVFAITPLAVDVDGHVSAKESGEVREQQTWAELVWKKERSSHAPRVMETRVESQRIQDFTIHSESRNEKNSFRATTCTQESKKTSREKNMSTVDDVVVFS
jgi:hypothetical protein